MVNSLEEAYKDVLFRNLQTGLLLIRRAKYGTFRSISHQICVTILHQTRQTLLCCLHNGFLHGNVRCDEDDESDED